MASIRHCGRALLSVSDKRGVVEFARGLHQLGWELISTGGTARAIVEAGLPVVPVEEYTGFPEMMDGRVKTLHPKVHGGILYRRDLPAHEQAADQHGIVSIDMVVVNLYPFEATVADPSSTPADIIENIDIGGPAMVRSAAKNHASVWVVVDPSRYDEVLEALRAGGDQLELRRQLAGAAYSRTAAYDAAISTWFERDQGGFPPFLQTRLEKVADLRYGENPHQSGAFYRRAGAGGPTLGNAKIIEGGGKELSYNNYLDADAALGLALDLPAIGCAVIKHANPCGAAVAADAVTAFQRALSGDPTSAFGGIVAMNVEIGLEVAEAMVAPGTFFEVIIAPAFAPGAAERIREGAKWGKNVRLLTVGPVDATVPLASELRSVSGGALAQDRDDAILGAEPPRAATQRAPDDSERRDLELAWTLAKHVRSNAITLVKDGTLVGVGAGQMSRVASVRIAAGAAGERARGAAMGSDAFFPFPDGVEAAAEAGVTSVIQPGGSMRDKEVIAACDERKMAMLFTGLRHFRH